MATPIDPRTRELADTLMTASRVLLAIAVRSVDTVSETVTVAQHRVLVVLASQGPQTISDIAADLAINPSNATRHCERLSQLGLVEKLRSRSDGRVVEVRLTRAGKRLLDQVTNARRAEIAAVLERLTPHQRDQVVDALSTFNAVAGEASDRDWVAASW